MGELSKISQSDELPPPASISAWAWGEIEKMTANFARAIMAGMTGRSFQVDGELISRSQATALAFSRPQRGSLDMRHRLPGHLVGLAASLRSMPTAVSGDYQVLIRWNGRSELTPSESLRQGKKSPPEFLVGSDRPALGKGICWRLQKCPSPKGWRGSSDSLVYRGRRKQPVDHDISATVCRARY